MRWAILILVLVAACQADTPKRKSVKGVAPIRSTTVAPVSTRPTLVQCKIQMDTLVSEFQKFGKMVDAADYHTQRATIDYAKSKGMIFVLKNPKKPPQKSF